jgi:uncharacterized Zn finger protein (UPF0148 family)
MDGVAYPKDIGDPCDQCGLPTTDYNGMPVCAPCYERICAELDEMNKPTLLNSLYDMAMGMQEVEDAADSNATDDEKRITKHWRTRLERILAHFDPDPLDKTPESL